jgi:hypothetical protein
MVIRFSTFVTPGIVQATRSASCRSAQDRTAPERMTSPPRVSTVMRLASISALRRNASSIFRWISVGATFDLSAIRLVTPLTPSQRP